MPRLARKSGGSATPRAASTTSISRCLAGAASRRSEAGSTRLRPASTRAQAPATSRSASPPAPVMQRILGSADGGAPPYADVAVEVLAAGLAPQVLTLGVEVLAGSGPGGRPMAGWHEARLLHRGAVEEPCHRRAGAHRD